MQIFNTCTRIRAKKNLDWDSPFLQITCFYSYTTPVSHRHKAEIKPQALNSYCILADPHSPDGCPKLNPVDEDVVVLLPNTEPCPNPELWPNAGAVLCPNSPEPVLLAVLAPLVPKEKELALLAVEAPKRPPPVVALLELAPNADWPKEKPLAVPVLLVGWPKPLAWPNTDLPKPVPDDAPNPAEPNAVDTGAAGAAGAAGADGAEGAEDTGGAEGGPNTVLAAVVVVLLTTLGVVAGLTVLITGETPSELLSVAAGAGWVKMEPGLSELGTWNATGATWETGAPAGVAAATGAVVVVLSGVASITGATLAGVGGVASAGAVMEEGASGVGAVVAKGGAGDGAVTVAAVVSAVTASAVGSATTGRLVLSTAGSVAGSFSGGGVGSEGCGGSFGSSDKSAEAARILLKDIGKAEATELDWGTEKAGLGFDSGGLNKLPDAAPLDKSAPVESSAAI